MSHSSQCRQCGALSSGVLHTETDRNVKLFSHEIFFHCHSWMCKYTCTHTQEQTHWLFLFLSLINHEQSVSHRAVNINGLIMCPLTCVINNLTAVQSIWEFIFGNDHTHTHTGWIYTAERSVGGTSRPQTPFYSQNGDVTIAISISHLEPGYLKPTRQLLCNSLFGSLPLLRFTPILDNQPNRHKNQR